MLSVPQIIIRLMKYKQLPEATLLIKEFELFRQLVCTKEFSKLQVLKKSLCDKIADIAGTSSNSEFISSLPYMRESLKAYDTQKFDPRIMQAPRPAPDSLFKNKNIGTQAGIPANFIFGHILAAPHTRFL